jgi:predicted NAD-dependent protein-ADP-ribosyltransferase YbiA (DUF1768 family)
MPWGDMTCPTLEHVYVLEKVIYNVEGLDRGLFMRYLLKCESAASAKKLCKVKERACWEDYKVKLMEHLLEIKFQYCEDFRKGLEKSMGVYLEHISVVDNFWATTKTGKRDGLNIHGLLLAGVRHNHFRRPGLEVLVMGHSVIKYLSHHRVDLYKCLEREGKHDEWRKRGQVNMFHGLSGAYVGTLLEYVKRTQLLCHYLPSVVILQIGGNDMSPVS